MGDRAKQAAGRLAKIFDGQSSADGSGHQDLVELLQQRAEELCDENERLRVFLDANSCGICGGFKVWVRAKYPGNAKRLVCPTCLVERMDQIQSVSDPTYGAAGTALHDKVPAPAGAGPAPARGATDGAM